MYIATGRSLLAEAERDAGRDRPGDDVALPEGALELVGDQPPHCCALM